MLFNNNPYRIWIRKDSIDVVRIGTLKNVGGLSVIVETAFDKYPVLTVDPGEEGSMKELLLKFQEITDALKE